MASYSSRRNSRGVHCVATPKWEYGGTSTDLPWLRHQTDRAGAIANMVSGATDLTIENFAIKDLLAGDDVVVALLDIAFVVNKTGKRATEVDAVQIWRFNAAGQVTRFRQRIDTHHQQLAWRE